MSTKTLEFLDLSDWQPEDKEWMKMRKKEWVFVQKNLKQTSSFLLYSSSYLVAHKQFFFKGCIDYTDGKTQNDFGGKLPLFVIWYHPSITDQLCEKLLDYLDSDQMKGYGLTGSTDFLTAYGTRSEYDKNYGFMGGREQWAAKYLFGKRAQALAKKYDFRLYGVSANKLVQKVSNAIIVTLNAKKSPWAVHQYLWEMMLERFDEAELDERTVEGWEMAFHRVAFYEEHRIVDSTNAHGRALREKILKEMETRDDLPKGLVEIWESVKAAGLPEEFQRKD